MTDLKTKPAEVEAAPAETAAPGEGCPPPLAWRDVLQRFQAEGHGIEVDRGRYRLRVHEFGSGPPLLLLGGASETADMFALLAWLLREDCRCLVLDRTGSVSQLSRWSRLSLSDLTADLFAVADALELPQFALYAASSSTAIGLSALLEQPERIAAAVLQSASARFRFSLAERALLTMARFWPGSLAGVPLFPSIQQRNHRDWFPPFDTTRWNFFLESSGSVPVQSFARLTRAVSGFDVRPRLSNIKTPVLLVETEGDGRALEPRQQELESGLPNVQSEWLPASGRLAYLTHPHRIASLIRGFLSTNDE